jgi:hypothetical protein
MSVDRKACSGVGVGVGVFCASTLGRTGAHTSRFFLLACLLLAVFFFATNRKTFSDVLEDVSLSLSLS